MYCKEKVIQHNRHCYVLDDFSSAFLKASLENSLIQKIPKLTLQKAAFFVCLLPSIKEDALFSFQSIRVQTRC